LKRLEFVGVVSVHYYRMVSWWWPVRIETRCRDKTYQS